MSQLPEGWEWTTLGDITASGVSQNGPQGETFCYIDISSVDNKTKRITEPKWLSVGAAPSRAKQNVKKGDILISLTRPNLNAVAQVTADLDDAVASTGFHVLRPIEVDSAYVHFFSQCRSFVEALGARVQGVVYPAVRPKDVMTIPVPLPPLTEQRRLVAKIEQQLTRLDAAHSLIQRAELKASVLLRDLMSPYRHAETLTDSTLLPGGWRWTTSANICDFITKGTTPVRGNLHKSGDVPFIKVNNLTRFGRLDFEGNPTFIRMEVHKNQLARSEVIAGDVLMNIVGPPLGKVCIVPPTHQSWNINQAIARFRPREGLLPDFLAIVLRSRSTLNWLIKRSKATAGQVNLTLETCRLIPIPLPSLAVQLQVVERVAVLTSQLEQNQKEVRRAHVQSSLLREAILVKAFSGQLVSQNPNDEPASLLLERIRAERANAPSPRLKRSTRKKITVESN